jgi:hypothetical protein
LDRLKAGQQLAAMALGNAIRKIGPLGSAVIALQVASVTREHWRSLPREDRARLQGLLRHSRGKPSNLSKSERRELRSLVGALQLPRLARESALSAAGIGRQLRRRRD